MTGRTMRDCTLPPLSASTLSGAQDETTREIATLVEKHRVRWALYPERRVNHETGEIEQIGFEIDLMGTHDAPPKPPLPGCDECVVVFRALSRIASWCVPAEHRDSVYDIGSFDARLRQHPPTFERQDVQVTLKILHREGYERPVDDCERRCLSDIEARLRSVGARRVSG